MHALSRRWVLNVNDFAKFHGTKGAGVVSKLARRQQPRKFLWILMKNGTGIAHRPYLRYTDVGSDGGGGAGGNDAGVGGAEQTRL